MTDFYVNGYQDESSEGTPFIEVLTPVGLTGAQVTEALATIDLTNVDPAARLYKLVDVGAVIDGVPAS